MGWKGLLNLGSLSRKHGFLDDSMQAPGLIQDLDLPQECLPVPGSLMSSFTEMHMTVDSCKQPL